MDIMSTPPTITLLGAGPGDPELLTLAGLRALEMAEVVVYDRLVNPALLAHAPTAQHIEVGKRPGENHALQQARINEIIVSEALAGRRVVRLKGGDPFIFGRGGEEVAAARAAGIPIRVIPGVTSALGAAAEAGFPLTHRDAASSVAFVTGCRAEGCEGGPDWRALARAVDTIVIYMGVSRLAVIAGELMAGGRPASEPVAIIRHATLPEREARLLTLGELTGDEGGAPIKPPSLLIVGQVVRLAHELHQLEHEATRMD